MFLYLPHRVELDDMKEEHEEQVSNIKEEHARKISQLQFDIANLKQQYQKQVKIDLLLHCSCSV